MMSDEEVRRAAILMGLDIPAEQLPRVAALLRAIEAIAGELAESKLDPFADEQAPVWRP